MNEILEEGVANDPAIVNGKRYSLWPQFVANKHKYIGGILQDLDNDPMFVEPGSVAPETEITDIVFKPNGKDSAWFEATGKDYSCGFDVSHGGVTGGAEGWVTFRGYGGHQWRIKAKEGK
jgi:hypothetical protein